MQWKTKILFTKTVNALTVRYGLEPHRGKGYVAHVNRTVRF